MSTGLAEVTSRVQQGYDKIADQYLAWTENRPSPRLRYVEKLLGQTPPRADTTGLTILELGCGAGLPVTKFLASHSHVKEVFANDISSKQLDLARQHVTGNADVNFISGDMLSLDFAKQTLDGVVAFFSLIHLPQPSQRDLLRRMYGWTRPGGYLVCNFGWSDKAAHKPHEISDDDHWGDFHDVPMYWAAANGDASFSILQEAGFELAEHEVLDATDGKETLDPNDPDYGVRFLWILARRAT